VNVFKKCNITEEIYNRALVGISTDKKITKEAWLESFPFGMLNDLSSAEDMLRFCESARDAINNNMDCILAVSNRVRDIAILNGIDKSKTIVNYIGTKIADRQIHYSTTSKSDYFKIVYLGSDINNEEKGYPFLLATLSSIRVTDAQKIDIVLTTTNGKEKEIKKQLSRYHSVKVIKGYSHNDLKSILGDAHLGIIPVLWEDNLPQIAIEMVAMGVPVLCSSFGGASELVDCDLFHFKGGDRQELVEKLLFFVNNPDELKKFWEHHKDLKTMKQHWSELEEIYDLQKVSISKIELSLEDYFQLLLENEFLYNELHNHARRTNVIPKKLYRRIGSKLKKVLKYYKINGARKTLQTIKSKLMDSFI